MVSLGFKSDFNYVDEVYLNDTHGCNIAANYLYNYHGISKIIYVGIKGSSRSTNRQNKFIKTLKNLNDSVDIKAIFYTEDVSEIASLIDNRYLEILCFTDQIAYSLMNSLNHLIPNIRRVYPKLHIIVFATLSTRMTGLNDLTSINYNYDKLCNTALKMIKNRLKKSTKEKSSICINVCLHQRKYK